MKTLPLVLIFLSFLCNAQKDEETESRISIIPKFGLGFAVPPFVKTLSGSTKLEPNFQNYLTNVVTDSDGNSNGAFKITNLLGVQGSYLLNNGLKANLGLMRAAHLNMLNDPIIVNNEQSKWVWGYNFYTLSAGLGKNFGEYKDSRLLQINLHYTLGFRTAGGDKQANDGNFVTNGNGILFANLSGNRHPIFIAPEYDFSLNRNTNSLFRFSIGAFVPLAIIGREKATFYQNSRVTGENQITFTQAAAWAKVRYVIDIESRKRVKPTPQPKTIPPPKTPKTVVYDGKKVNEGENIVLKNIQFEQTKSVLGTDGMGELDKVAQLMYGYPNMIIEIVGHTSTEGDRVNNIELSSKRAKICKEYLTKKGIASNRIVVRGMGPDQPLSKTDQSQNRRVEMKIIRVR
jgi:outer membrane protein OmpA-like peptidoglycan-associated protein